MGHSFYYLEKPVARLAAAKGLEQLQRVGADADGAGLAALAEEANVAAFIQRFDVLPRRRHSSDTRQPSKYEPRTMT